MLTAHGQALDVDAALEAYARDGYVRLGRVLDDEGLEALRARTDALMLGEVVHEGLFFQPDATTGRYEDAPLGLGWQGPSLDYRKLEKLEKDPVFRAWIENPLAQRLVAKAIDGAAVLYRTIVFNKGPRGGSDIPWHQDGGKLWGLSEDPHFQFWTALDDAPLGGGCLEVVPGSHRWGLATALGGVVPADQVAARAAASHTVPLPVGAGESVLIHNLVWHRSGAGIPGRRRRAMSVCYMSERVRCLRTKKTPRTFFPVFRTELI